MDTWGSACGQGHESGVPMSPVPANYLLLCFCSRAEACDDGDVNPLAPDDCVDYESLEGAAGDAGDEACGGEVSRKPREKPGRKRLPRFLISGDHPQADHYAHRPMEEYTLNQMFADVPARPSNESPFDDRQRYAGFVLANFTSDRHAWVQEAIRLSSISSTPCDLWPIMLSWEGTDNTLHGRLARHFLANMNDHITARQHNSAQAKLHRAHLNKAKDGECVTDCVRGWLRACVTYSVRDWRCACVPDCVRDFVTDYVPECARARVPVCVTACTCDYVTECATYCARD